MKRRLSAALAASALAVMAAGPAGTAAAGPVRDFQRIDPKRIDKALVAKALASQQVDVIVELDAPPAIERAASRDARVAVAEQMKSTQDELDASIRKLGARIQSKYQYAYDGIRVHVPSRALARLERLPGVRALHAVVTHQLENRTSVPFISAPSVWRTYGKTGAGQIIAVIDSGIDYTHANFGGAGTAAAYSSDDPTIIEPGSFPTSKVIGGWDFVGEAYNPGTGGPGEIPVPDPDPLDCIGHGSHVAGTAAGFGVKSDHTTYPGPYDGNTYRTAFEIGPGVAPRARLIALKVFGCGGGTSVVTEALEWVARYNATHAKGIDVVNMSLGGLGGDDTADAAASNNLVASGVTVVAAAGNEGPNAYMTSSPGNATGVLSVAAEDIHRTHPGATIDLAASDLTALNENAHPALGATVTGTLKFVVDDGTTPGVDEHLGCTKSDYGTLAVNTIVVIQRGSCTFVEKGAAAEAAGAIAVIVYNRDDVADPNEPPPFIGFAPSEFAIPMIGIGRGAEATLQAADGQSATLKVGPAVANPHALHLADFSSGGPRLLDSAVKPDVTAPGVDILSTAVGLGHQGDTFSGTSMASPHAAGVAALIHAAHPSWRPRHIKSAIVGTALASRVAGYQPRLAGSGMINAKRAVDTVAFVLARDGTPSLSFGYDQIRFGSYVERKTFRIFNTGNSRITYRLAGDSTVTVSPARLTVPAHSSRPITATISISRARLARTRYASQTAIGGTPYGRAVVFQGVITATPTVARVGRYQLRIPYQAVPRAASNVVASARSGYSSGATPGTSTATLELGNSGIHATFADVYAWGLSDPRDMPSGASTSNDIRAVGLQVLPVEAFGLDPDPHDRALVWAINTWGRWSTGSQAVWTIRIFAAGAAPDADPEFTILAVDEGFAFAGDFNGRMISIVLDSTGDVVDAFTADAPANGSTILIPALASDIGRTAPDAAVDYGAVGETILDMSEPGSGLMDEVAGRAHVSVFEPAVSSGDLIRLDPAASATLDLLVNDAQQAAAPSLGWMIVELDDPNGPWQADLVPAQSP